MLEQRGSQYIADGLAGGRNVSLQRWELFH